MKLFDVIKVFHEWVGNHIDKAAFLITGNRSNNPRVRECANTKILGAERLLFHHYIADFPIRTKTLLFYPLIIPKLFTTD